MLWSAVLVKRGTSCLRTAPALFGIGKLFLKKYLFPLHDQATLTGIQSCCGALIFWYYKLIKKIIFTPKVLFHISLFFNTATTLSGAEVCMKKEVFIGQIRESLTKHVCVSFFLYNYWILFHVFKFVAKIVLHNLPFRRENVYVTAVYDRSCHNQKLLIINYSFINYPMPIPNDVIIWSVNLFDWVCKGYIIRFDFVMIISNVTCYWNQIYLHMHNCE